MYTTYEITLFLYSLVYQSLFLFTYKGRRGKEHDYPSVIRYYIINYYDWLEYEYYAHIRQLLEWRIL